MSDTFFEGLCGEHNKIEALMQAEIGRLRREVASLKNTLNAMPSILTEFQDRVTLLEGLLRAKGP